MLQSFQRERQALNPKELVDEVISPAHAGGVSQEETILGRTFQLEEQILTPKERLEEAITTRTLTMRESLLQYLKWAFSAAFVFTMSVVYLDAFQIGGFDVPDGLLMLLGGAVVGEVAGLIAASIAGFLSERRS